MIDVKGLWKSFDAGSGQIEILKGIDLEVAEGQRVAIVGTSGAGKTTLMHILGGLDHPTEGEVRVEGSDLFALKGAELDRFRNRTVGFVFQFHQLLPEFTAVENVMMPALIARTARNEAAAAAEKMLDEVGLSHRLTHKPGQLSGGEQQRVAIARALIQSPRILLADEPTGNLDSSTSEEIFQLIDTLHQRHGLTMVVVTHNEDLARRLDRVVRMEDGHLKE